jgi:hypothetical protein
MISEGQIEAMIRDLVETNLSEDARAAALEWLDKRATCYEAMLDLGLVEQQLDRAAG